MIYCGVIHLIVVFSCRGWLQNWIEVHCRSVNNLRIDSATALGYTSLRWSTLLGPLALQVWLQKLLLPIGVGKTSCFLVAGNSHLCVVRRANWLWLARSACHASTHHSAVLNCGPSATQIDPSTNFWCLPNALCSRLSLCLRVRSWQCFLFVLLLLGYHIAEQVVVDNFRTLSQVLAKSLSWFETRIRCHLAEAIIPSVVLYIFRSFAARHFEVYEGSISIVPASNGEVSGWILRPLRLSRTGFTIHTATFSIILQVLASTATFIFLSHWPNRSLSLSSFWNHAIELMRTHYLTFILVVAGVILAILKLILTSWSRTENNGGFLWVNNCLRW